MAASWFLRVGIATAMLTGIGVLAERGNASATALPQSQDVASTPHGIQLSQQTCSSKLCATAVSMGVGARH